MCTYLVTGGAGFIGANFVKYLLSKHGDLEIVILDKLTYSGNLCTIKEEITLPNVHFIHGDICDSNVVIDIFKRFDINYVVNFAAESHVDRSIVSPQIFLETNIIGTQVLLDAAKDAWSIGKDDSGYPVYMPNRKFLQVSTDEVYGALEVDYPNGMDIEVTNEFVRKALHNRKSIPQVYGSEMFTEVTALDPKSPYSTSKTAADMLVRAYDETYHMPVNVTRCSNNYGPFHYPEKLIPLMIMKVLKGEKLPVYGDGKQVRDWLYVDDHCKGIEMVLKSGTLGEIYNIGGFNEAQNIDIVKLVIDIIRDTVMSGGEIKSNYVDIVKCTPESLDYNLITYVEDRLGHDVRYAIDPTKTVKDLGFYPETTFEDGIVKTIEWFLENQWWVEEVIDEN